MKSSSSARRIEYTQQSEELTALETLQIITNAALDAKGLDIKILDVNGISDVANFFVLVSGRSDRQVLGITNKVIDECAKVGVEYSVLEGAEKAQWVLVEFGDIVMHVFYETQREHYDLEGLWLKAKQLKISKPNKSGHVKVS